MSDVSPTAFDLIDEARFARRMLAITDASLAKIEAAGALSAPPAGPTRLEVPTVSAAGWSDAVLYVIRAERSKGTSAGEIASMLERMFAVEVSAQVVLAGVLHFDLDRRPPADKPITVEVAVPSEVPALEPPCGGMTGAVWAAAQEAVAVDDHAPEVDGSPDPVAAPAADWRDEARNLYDGGAGLIPFEIAKRIGIDVHDVCVAVVPGFGEKCEKRRARLEKTPSPVESSADWKAEAIRLYDGGAGMSPFAISKQVGVSDFRVRCAVVPGFKEKWNGHKREVHRQISEKAAADRPEPKPRAQITTEPKAPRGKADTDREETRFRELWSKGRSFSEIAKIMADEGFPQRTRNAWIGKAARLGLKRPPQVAAHMRGTNGAHAAKAKLKPARKAVSKAPPTPLPWSPPARVVADTPAEVPAAGEGIHITDLEHHHCRWPRGRGADGHETYCGCQKSEHGGSYCDAHARIAFNVWPPRTPLPKMPTRMARQMSALPAYDTRTTKRRA